jgi:hypothetical protein
MRTEQSYSRALTLSERALAVAVGVGMLAMSFLALIVTVALYMPLHSLVEGLSK